MNSLSNLLATRTGELSEVLKNDIFVSPTPKNGSNESVDLEQLKKIALVLRDNVDSLIRALQGEEVRSRSVKQPENVHAVTGERVIEGVFTGEKMIGQDGVEYAVPANYASKSKLVEGDMMKLTITNSGSFIYKQVGPLSRKRIVGELVCDTATQQWSVLCDGRPYRVLNASVSFHKGTGGEHCVILVPEDGESQWGAVENIIH